MCICRGAGIESWRLLSASFSFFHSFASSFRGEVLIRGTADIHSLAGQVCLWDIRLTEPIKTLQAHQGGLTHMTVHEHAPIFATCVFSPVFPLLLFRRKQAVLTVVHKTHSSAFNVVKLWNMNDLSEPFSKFRNNGALPSSLFSLCILTAPPPSRPFSPLGENSRSPLLRQSLLYDPHGLPPTPHGPRVFVGRRSHFEVHWRCGGSDGRAYGTR
jgi:WD40 repeat protein